MIGESTGNENAAKYERTVGMVFTTGASIAELEPCGAVDGRFVMNGFLANLIHCFFEIRGKRP